MSTFESGIDPTAIAPRQPGADASGGALRTGFTAMTEGTQADWNRIVEAQLEFYPGLTDRVMSHLGVLSGDYGGFTVDRLSHSLQTATRAVRANRSDSYVACALLHDIGDTLGSFNHPDIGAAIVWPFVDDDLHWMVQQHGIFQGYYFFHHLGMDRTTARARALAAGPDGAGDRRRLVRSGHGLGQVSLCGFE